MIRRHFDQTKLDPRWLQKAEDATDAIIVAYERWRTEHSVETFVPKEHLDASVWSELKNWLLEHVFYQKCAYCEVRLTRDHGAAEHFRPKGRVTSREYGARRPRTSVAMTTDECRADCEHPGYFWLAYDWRNLVPSCDRCNNHKGSCFMTKCYVFMCECSSVQSHQTMARNSLLWSEWCYPSTEMLDELEDPLLLNPLTHEPKLHLKFGECGIIAAKDESVRGEASIHAFGLADEELRKDRQEEQEHAITAYLAAQIGRQISIKDRRRMAEEALREYKEGRRPFSAAVLDYIELYEEEMGSSAERKGEESPR